MYTYTSSYILLLYLLYANTVLHSYHHSKIKNNDHNNNNHCYYCDHNRKKNSNTHGYVCMYMCITYIIYTYFYAKNRWWNPISFDMRASFADLASFPSEQQGPVPSNREDQVQERTAANLKGLNNSWMRRMQRMRKQKNAMHLFWQPHQILWENFQIVAASKRTAKNSNQEDGRKTQRMR